MFFFSARKEWHGVALIFFSSFLPPFSFWAAAVLRLRCSVWDFKSRRAPRCAHVTAGGQFIIAHAHTRAYIYTYIPTLKYTTRVSRTTPPYWHPHRQRSGALLTSPGGHLTSFSQSGILLTKPTFLPQDVFLRLFIFVYLFLFLFKKKSPRFKAHSSSRSATQDCRCPL